MTKRSLKKIMLDAAKNKPRSNRAFEQLAADLNADILALNTAHDEFFEGLYTCFKIEIEDKTKDGLINVKVITLPLALSWLERDRRKNFRLRLDRFDPQKINIYEDASIDAETLTIKNTRAELLKLIHNEIKSATSNESVVACYGENILERIYEALPEPDQPSHPPGRENRHS